MAEVTFTFSTSGLAGSSTWVPGTVPTTTQHFLMFDVLSFEYELKGVWGWWDKEEYSLHKVPDEGTGDASWWIECEQQMQSFSLCDCNARHVTYFNLKQKLRCFLSHQNLYFTASVTKPQSFTSQGMILDVLNTRKKKNRLGYGCQ